MYRPQIAHFSRMDSDEKTSVECTDWDTAQEVANQLGREGWVLQIILPVPCHASIRYSGPTFSGSYKWAWRFECSCGDEDSSYTKTAITASAKRHTPNITAYNRDGAQSK